MIKSFLVTATVGVLAVSITFADQTNKVVIPASPNGRERRPSDVHKLLRPMPRIGWQRPRSSSRCDEDTADRFDPTDAQ